MALLTKFPLSGHHFLSIGLNGKQPEVRITSPGRITHRLTVSELDILSKNSDSIMQKEVQLSTTESPLGGVSYRKCCPAITSGGIQFLTIRTHPDQPQDFNDFMFLDYTLEKNSALNLVKLLPKIMEAVQVIIDQEPSISLAYEILHEQIKRLCDSQDSNQGIENFLNVMRLLHQHVPQSFLVSQFKKRSTGTVLNVNALIHNVSSQFEYIYINLYSQ